MSWKDKLHYLGKKKMSEEGKLALNELLRVSQKKEQIIELRQCRKCYTLQSITNFSRDKKSKGGRRWICKNCSKLYLREWQEQNREKYRALLRKNWKEHYDERLKYTQIYRQRNKKKLIAHELRKHNKRLLPLAPTCEFCNNDDVKHLQRHHPDYDYPELYVTVCHTCNCCMETAEK